MVTNQVGAKKWNWFTLKIFVFRSQDDLPNMT